MYVASKEARKFVFIVDDNDKSQAIDNNGSKCRGSIDKNDKGKYPTTYNVIMGIRYRMSFLITRVITN
jgi:hypothetical protein